MPRKLPEYLARARLKTPGSQFFRAASAAFRTSASNSAVKSCTRRYSPRSRCRAMRICTRFAAAAYRSCAGLVRVGMLSMTAGLCYLRSIRSECRFMRSVTHSLSRGSSPSAGIASPVLMPRMSSVRHPKRTWTSGSAKYRNGYVYGNWLHHLLRRKAQPFAVVMNGMGLSRRTDWNSAYNGQGVSIKRTCFRNSKPPPIWRCGVTDTTTGEQRLVAR